jgi:hypothetical protein
MKIIYLFTSPSLKGSSVQNKVLSQIKSLNKIGANCKGAFFSTEVEQVYSFNEYVDFIPVDKCNWKYFRSLGQYSLVLRKTYQFISDKFSVTDFFYLRYSGASLRLYFIVKKFGKKIISEHQSKEIIEINESSAANPFNLRPSKFLSWFNYQFIPIFNEKIWGILFARKVKAIVTVTNELALYQKAKGCEKVFIVPNGIDVSLYRVRLIPKLEKDITILFLKGTSTLASWNGLDRIINSIDAFHKSNKSEYSFKLLICGRHFKNEFPVRDYIIHLDYLQGNDLDNVFNIAHIAASTMCSFRRGLEESAILKSREYFARGIPFIYAYKDVDFDESKIVKENTLHFVNDDSILDMDKVVQFTINRINHHNHAQEMNRWASENLDYNIKMKALNNVLKTLV